MVKFIFFVIATLSLLTACDFRNDKLERELIDRQNEKSFSLKDMKSLANINARFTQVCAIPPAVKRIPLESLKNGNSLMMKEAQILFQRKNIYSETHWNLIFFRENSDEMNFLSFDAQLVNLFFANKAGAYCGSLDETYFVRIQDSNRIVYMITND